jgi:TonB-linked SusC/RagA family outer membrane protein
MMQLYAENTFSQSTTVHIRKNTLTLRELISEIEDQTDFLFIFSKDDINVGDKLKINTKSRQIGDILSDAFKNSGITYTFTEQYITLRKISEAEKISAADGSQQTGKRITGRVVDTDNEPVIGANIKEKGATANGTVTDAEGNFSLDVADNAILQVSFIGYITQEVGVSSAAGGNHLVIKLLEDTQALDEVVVVGYGTMKKVNLTGAVSVVKSDEIMQRKVGQTSAALQGVAAGVAVTQRSGQPGRDGGSISIRGKTTLGNNDALILVDGVEMGINDIDQSLIESISILKDAASSAIYGSRAANGVILVTTKRGQTDQFSATYNGSVGWQQPTNLPKIVDAFDFMGMQDIAYINSGATPIYGETRINEWRNNYLTNPDYYPNTDWQEETLKHAGFENSHNFTMSGGTNKIKALLALGRIDQNGFISNTGYVRNTIRLNTDLQISKHLKAKADLHVKQAKFTEPAKGTEYIIHWMNRIPPTQAAVYQNGQWGEGWNGDHPVAASKDGGTRVENASSITANLSLQYQPVEWLSAEFGYAPNYWQSHISNFNKAVQTYKADGATSFLNPDRSTLTEVAVRYHQNLMHFTTNFDKTFGYHNVKALLGFQQEEYRMDRFEGYRETFVFPDYPVLNAGGIDVQRSSGTAEEWGIRSYFGRINYAFMNKYLFEANLRADGSSRFTKDNRWGYFPSFSLGWRLSEERLWEPVKNTVDELKIIGSWGQLGNQNIGSSYPTVSTINLTSTKYIFNGGIQNGATATAMANKGLVWETTESWNAGLNARLWHKLSITGDYFYKKTNDILLTLDIPRIIGLSAPYQNAGVVENRGWEVDIRYSDYDHELKYSVSFNLSDVKNKVLDLKGQENSGLQVNREGYPMFSLNGYKSIGYITEADFDESGKYTGPVQNGGNVAPGDLKYKDQNEDNVITPADQVIFGNVIPRYTYGFNAFLEYKGFDFSFLIQGVGKADGYITDHGIMPFFNGAGAQEQHKDYWTPTNRNAAFPRLVFNGANNTQYSSFWMKDAAYLRLKNIQLGYTLPARITRIINIKRLRIYAGAQNLFTIDKFWDGYDVEAPIGNGGYYPQTIVYTCGLDIKF